MRAWLLQTHGVQFELVRHFLRQQFASDLIPSEQVRRLVITAYATLACVGPLIVYLYMGKYEYLLGLTNPTLHQVAVRADRLFFISLSMIAAGFVTAAQLQSLFPNRRDYLALKPLPVRLPQIFIARLLSSFVVVVTVNMSLNLAASVLFPAIASGSWPFPPFGIRHVLAHAVATVAGGLWVFGTLTTMQGAFLNLLSPRTFERLSVLIQIVLATLFVASVPYVADMPNWHHLLAKQPNWMRFFPPAWFLGLYEILLGSADSYHLRLGKTAVMASGIVFVIGLTFYLLAYRRHAARVLEQALSKPSVYTRIVGSCALMMERLTKNLYDQAVFGFAVQTLRRSRHHRLVVGFCGGIALVFGLQTAGSVILTHLWSREPWSTWQLQSLLALPLVTVAVMISALCFVFQLPSEIAANWVFRVAESSGREGFLDCVERLLISCGLLPVLLLSLPIEVACLGWRVALAHQLLTAMLALFLIEVRLREWHKIPFTCSYIAGRRNIWQTVAVCLFGFGAVIPIISNLEAYLLNPLSLIASAIVLGLAYFPTRAARRTHGRLVPLIFDEGDEPLIGTICIDAD